MLRFYADEHVILAVVNALRSRSVDVITVQEFGGEGMPDDELLAKAIHDHRAILTNDADFLVLAARHQTHGEAFAPIFFWPQQQRAVGDLFRRIIREANLVDYSAACSRVFFL